MSQKLLGTMNSLNKVKLEDYKEPEYLIPDIFLDISIMQEVVKVVSRYSIERNNIDNKQTAENIISFLNILKGFITCILSFTVFEYLINHMGYFYLR